MMTADSDKSDTIPLGGQMLVNQLLWNGIKKEERVSTFPQGSTAEQEVISGVPHAALDGGKFGGKVIDHLADGLAHDFKNLLQVISGSTMMAMELSEESSDQIRELRRVLEAADRGSRMVNKLLGLGREPSMESVPLNLNDLILSVTELLGNAIDRRILYDFRLYSNLDLAFTDSDAVEQILVNLLLNARDAMPEGGRLLIETGPPRIDTDSGLENPDAEGKHYVRFTVTDSGEGMTPEVLGKMFDPYFTTKHGKHGSGMGMFMVRTLVRRLGGKIRAKSEPRRGTRIEVLLPIYVDEEHLAQAGRKEEGV